MIINGRNKLIEQRIKGGKEYQRRAQAERRARKAKTHKYYFEDGGEFCYTLEFWRDYMEEQDLAELKLFAAQRDLSSGYFFCREFQSVGERGNCGVVCEAYSPRNGKSGACKDYGFVYEQTDKELVLTRARKSIVKIQPKGLEELLNVASKTFKPLGL